MILPNGANHVEQTVPVGRPADDGETVVGHPPQFLAGIQIVSRDVIRARADELIRPVDRLNERCGVGHLGNTSFFRCGLQMGSGLFPADFAGPLFQRDDELKIDAVAGQQQEVVMEDGGTVTTLNYVVFELGVLPNDFAVSF